MPTKGGGRQEMLKIPIINVHLKLPVWVVKHFLSRAMARCAKIPPKVDVIPATQAWCVLFVTKGII